MNEEKTSRCWWLTPVILTIKEADLREIVVQSQPWANTS
jgi:hypothetical protein